MKANEVVERLTQAFPRSATWDRLAGEPYGPANVDPAAEVKRVLYCVTATSDVEEFYGRGGYDLLVAHHPFRPVSPIPSVVLHTALDCAPGGLNDIWRVALGIEDARPITGNLGWVGQIAPIDFAELLGRIRAVAGGIDGQVSSSRARIGSVAVCTGLGGMVAAEAAATGADAYVTGEARSAGVIDRHAGRHRGGTHPLGARWSRFGAGSPRNEGSGGCRAPWHRLVLGRGLWRQGGGVRDEEVPGSTGHGQGSSPGTSSTPQSDQARTQNPHPPRCLAGSLELEPPRLDLRSSAPDPQRTEKHLDPLDLDSLVGAESVAVLRSA